MYNNQCMDRRENVEQKKQQQNLFIKKGQEAVLTAQNKDLTI